MPTNPETFGRFEGDVITKWLTEEGDDRDMELVEDFAYVDPAGKKWLAPKGRKINGASIPPQLWSLVGPPFVGDYRRASVVHDIACEDEPGTSDEAHKMFYYAMRCDGVDRLQALIMYRAVKSFGPQWERSRLLSIILEPILGEGTGVDFGTQPLDALRAAVEAADNELSDDADLETLDRRIDKAMAEQ